MLNGAESYSLRVTRYWLLVTGYCLLITGYWLPVTSFAGSRVTQQVEVEIERSLGRSREATKSIVSFTPPSTLSWGNMTIGEHLDEDADEDNNIYIKTTENNWSLSISCDNSEKWAGDSSGHMNEYNVETSTYVASGRFLQQALQWKGGDQTTYIDITSTDETILANQPPVPGGDNVYIDFRQAAGYGDQVLASGTSYFMVITYTLLEL